MASGSSRANIDQFFPAKKRRPSSRKDEPPSGSPRGAKGSLEGYLVRSPSTAAAASLDSPRGGGDAAGARRSLSAAMDVDVGHPATAVATDEGDFELKRFAMEFLSLSHYCSVIPSVMGGASNGEAGKQQKRSAIQSFLAPCSNASAKKQRVAHSGDLEALKVVDVGHKTPFREKCGTQYGGPEAWSFTPNTGQKRVGFSTAPGAGETPMSVSTNSLISPGEEFWNAAIEFADGISARAEKGPGRPECDADDKSSCAVALCSKILPRSGNGGSDHENTVGSNETKQMDRSSYKEEPVAANNHHVNSSPLPVKHLDFFHEDEIQVPGLKIEEKGGAVDLSPKSQMKNRENLTHSVDNVNKSTFDMHIDSSATIHDECLSKLTTEGKNHPTRVGDSGSCLTRRDLNQLIYSEDKLLTAYSDHGKPSKDCTNKFASQEMEANTPTSSVPQKDHSKLSSWLPPELCAIYMKKGIPELYPWQVECLLVEGVLEKRNLVYCASTSAGKSFVAEILMLRRILFSGKMAILVLPYVSICAEKAEHLEQLLEPLGRHVRSFYGNQGGGSLPKDTSVAVCTIEKANSLVNKLLEEGRLSELGIIVIDELHMVGDQHRGYLLELMLTKLRYAAGEGNSESSSGEISGSSSGKMDATHGLQIIGMSATMPNVAAVADWLQAALYQTEFRPVPLEEFIKVGNQVFDKDMNVVRVLPKVADLGGKDPDHIVELCNEVVQQGHSVLLFCSSRKGCESTARHVAKFLKVASVGSSDVGSEFPDATFAVEALKRSPSGLDPVLEETLPSGVAYHHAGLTVEEREIVETCYRKGLVRVLAATSTLAAGVNLPARRVIFRQPRIGRDFIDGTRYKQMSGRAGRTGIDTKGESILVCKPEEVKRITGILRSNCTPLESCLSEDKNGMTHAIMEVVAGGIVQTASDIHRYVRCTLLNSTKPFEDVVKSAQDSLRWLCHKRFLEWNNETKIYSTTPLGLAAFGSSLNPEESLVVLDDLSRAREGFVLACDLHLVYLVTPINVDVEPDWELYYERFMQLTSLEQSVGNRVGVIEPFLMHMAHGAAMPVRGKPQRAGIRNRSPTRGSGGNALINEQALRVSKRFYVALMLSRLAQEIPVTDVCEAFKVARGMIQALQENAGRFASMVSVFCQRLGWHDLEGLVAKFQNRVCFGVRAEIAELTSIPFVKGSRARALYKSGLRTPVAIAEASIPEIAKALFESSTWSGQGDSGLRRMQLGIAKKIKNGARKIVLEEAEAARVAAFSAFKSLGVQVPQFTTPLLPTIDEPPTRDSMVSVGRGQASDDTNNCFSYGSQRASTERTLGNDMHPGSSIQITESARIVNNANIVVQVASPFSIETKLSSRNVADKGPVNAYNFPGGFDSFLDQWSTVSEFSFDLHYVKKSIKSSSTYFDILGLAVCWENSPVYYCNFPKDLMMAGSNDSIEMWDELTRRWNRVIEIMRQNSVKKMTWNLKFQIQALKYPCVSCQRLSRLHLDYKMLKNVEVLDNLYVFLQPVSVHSGLDICLVAWVLWPDEESKTVPNLEKTRALCSVLRKLLVSQNLNDLLETIEGPLVNVLADMELWGIGADMDACLRARHIIIRKLKELEKEAYKLAGKSFSLNATADIADVLYTHLKLPVPKGCGKGKLHPSTDKQSLDHLRDQHPIISVIKEHRTLAKLLNGTLGSICSRAQLCSKSQRYIIQGNWLQTSTATGRLSMEEPNLQENWLLVTADYSQIELRLMAHFSKDTALIELLSKPDGDVFTMIASRWTGKAESLICSKERETTKRFIYGILYGMGANSLAEQLECSPEDAAQKIQSFKRFFPGVSSWLHEAVASCRHKGYVETLMGRRRFLSKITAGNSKEKAKAQRQAVNSICQGSAADIIKVAMIKVHSAITNGSTVGATVDSIDVAMQNFSEIRGRCHLILQVHDELVLEVDPCMVAEAVRLLQTVMENSASLLGPSVSFLLLRATLNLYKTGYIASVTESIVENED
ncbi:hypothetical protein OsI_38041 [Oryza sativa Indica Group]|uniref:Helicase and polymerase-containing protein TEBICHI n=1 Tax=Oryza sativa subsp. indica TaxID=39946 RepID=B8BP75_ORYSI|nr:hypothetical protein OsI_38041 [Oryza sativa Indica Group]